MAIVSESDPPPPGKNAAATAAGARPKAADSLKSGDKGDFYEDCVALDCLYSLFKSFRREGSGDSKLLSLSDFKFGLQLQADAKKFEDVVVGVKLEGQNDDGYRYYLIQVKNNSSGDEEKLDVGKLALKGHFEGYQTLKKRLESLESNLSDGKIEKVVWLSDHTGLHFKRLTNELPLDKISEEPLLKALLPETVGSQAMCHQINSVSADLQSGEVKKHFGSGTDTEVRDFLDHLLIVTGCTGADKLNKELLTQLGEEGVGAYLPRQMAEFKRDKNMLWLTPDTICNRTIVFQGNEVDLSSGTDSIFKGLHEAISGKGLLQLYCRPNPVIVGQTLEKPDLPNNIFLPRRILCFSSKNEVTDAKNFMLSPGFEGANQNKMVVISSPAHTGKSTFLKETAYRAKEEKGEKIWLITLSLSRYRQFKVNVKEMLVQQLNDEFEKTLLAVAGHSVVLLIDDLEYALSDPSNRWSTDLDKFVKSLEELNFFQIWIVVRPQMHAFVTSKCNNKHLVNYALVPPSRTEVITHIEKALKILSDTKKEQDIFNSKLIKAEIVRRVGHLLPDDNNRIGSMAHIPAYLGMLIDVLFYSRLEDAQLAKIDTEYILMKRYISLCWLKYKERTLNGVHCKDVLRSEEIRFFQRHEMKVIRTFLGGRVKVGGYFGQNVIFPDNVLINDGLLQQGKNWIPFYNSAVFSYLVVQFIIKNIRDAVNWQSAKESFTFTKRLPARWHLIDRQLIQAFAGGKEKYLIFQEGPERCLKWYKEHYNNESKYSELLEKDLGGRTPLHLAASSLHQGPLSKSKELLHFLLENVNQTQHAQRQHFFENRDRFGFSILDHISLSVTAVEFYADDEEKKLLGGPSVTPWWTQAVRKVPHVSPYLHSRESFIRLRAHLENAIDAEFRIFILCTIIPEVGLSESTKKEMRDCFPYLPVDLIKGDDALLEFRSLSSNWNRKKGTVNGEYVIVVVPLVPIRLWNQRHRRRRQDSDSDCSEFEYKEYRIDWIASAPALEKLRQYLFLSVALNGRRHANIVRHFPDSDAKMHHEVAKHVDDVFKSCGESWEREFALRGKGVKGEQMKSFLNLGLKGAGSRQIDEVETNFDKYGYEKWNIFTYANAFEVQRNSPPPDQVEMDTLAESFQGLQLDEGGGGSRELSLPRVHPSSGYVLVQSNIPLQIPADPNEKFVISEKDVSD